MRVTLVHVAFICNIYYSKNARLCLQILQYPMILTYCGIPIFRKNIAIGTPYCLKPGSNSYFVSGTAYFWGCFRKQQESVELHCL